MYKTLEFTYPANIAKSLSEFNGFIIDKEKEITTYLILPEPSTSIEKEKEITTNINDISIASSSILSNTTYNEQLNNLNNTSVTITQNEKINSEENLICSEDYPYQNTLTKECLKSCSVEEIKNKICKINSLSNSNIINITSNIRNMILQKNMSSDTNIIIEGENTIYQLISSEEMSSNENTNISIIDLGDCEKKLLDEYHLDYLLILKIDTKLTENTAVILNYEVYNPITNVKLNLSICSDTKIYTYSSYYPSVESISKIEKLNELGYDLYDINGEFYQDICSSFTSANGTDILLSDRKSDYYENVSLCENDCSYQGYDLEKKRIKCECPVKEEISVEETEDEKNILEDFFDGSNFSNIKLLKCFKLVFSLKGQKNNIGSIIFLGIIFSLIILGIIYGLNQEAFIIRNISKINNEKYKTNLNNLQNPISFPPKKAKQNNKINSNNKKVLILSYVNNHKSTNSNSNLDKKFNSNFIISEKNQKEETVKYDLYNFTNEELNSLSYDLAFSYDKRSYFQYYISLLKQKHLIIFTFFNNQDYNIFTLKLSLFLSSFALYFAVNALFFNDSTMHQIYEQSGKQDIISQISNIFYSTIISCAINIIIKNLGLSYNDMVRIKQIPNEIDGLKESVLLVKKLKIKFAIFFIIIFIFDTFFGILLLLFALYIKILKKI